MLSPVEDPPALDVSIEPSSCNIYTQELRTNETSGNADGTSSERALCRFPCSISPNLIRKVAAEAVGTFMVVFCVYGILASMSLMGVKTGLIEYAATAALTVTVVVISFGPISGAHVNPAVTVAFAAVGPFPWSKVPLYVAAQVGGSVLGTAAGWFVYGIDIELLMTRPTHGCSAAFWVEFIASFIILFLIATMANDPKSTAQLSAFVAGVAIGLGVLITGPVSGGSMNPARSLGPAILLRDFNFLWIYIVAPTSGSICGGLLYRILRLEGWSCRSTSPSSRTSVCQLCHSTSVLPLELVRP